MAENVSTDTDELFVVWQRGDKYGTVALVITSSYAEEVLTLLTEEVVSAQVAPWADRSSASEALTTVVAVAKDSAAWAAIGLALRKFFDRHKGKRIKVDENGLAEAENYSAQDIERIVQALSAVEQDGTDA